MPSRQAGIGRVDFFQHAPLLIRHRARPVLQQHSKIARDNGDGGPEFVDRQGEHFRPTRIDHFGRHGGILLQPFGPGIPDPRPGLT